jgi:hypothetical protein
MLYTLLTLTIVIGIVLTALLLFVLGKLTWLESATSSLLTKIEQPLSQNAGHGREIEADPYFYGLSGQTLWNSLTGEDAGQTTPLELEEIRPRYSIALLKAVVKFIVDGRDSNASSPAFELEKLVFTSRGGISIWLPPSRIEALRLIGTKISQSKQSKEASAADASESKKRLNDDQIRGDITAEVINICESVGLRHGNDIASDVCKAFFPSAAD